MDILLMVLANLIIGVSIGLLEAIGTCLPIVLKERIKHIHWSPHHFILRTNVKLVEGLHKSKIFSIHSNKAEDKI